MIYKTRLSFGSAAFEDLDFPFGFLFFFMFFHSMPKPSNVDVAAIATATMNEASNPLAYAASNPGNWSTGTRFRTPVAPA